jgi:hypothetical protein
LSAQDAAEAHGKPAHDANSDDVALSASTVAACRSVSSGHGLMQSAAAVSGESGRPVVGSRGSGVIGVAFCLISPPSADALRRRHPATNRIPKLSAEKA